MSLKSKSGNEKNDERYWELDFVRGVAIAAMVCSHCLYQLYYVFEAIDFVGHKYFYYAGKMAAVFFILLGLSLYIGVERIFYRSFEDVLKRSLSIFGVGMLITVLTWIAQTGWYIFFGVLHCLGASTLLAYFFLKWNKWIILFFAVILIALDFVLPFGHNPYLYPLFHNYLTLDTFDYFPLIPNLGYVLLGVWLGKMFYKHGHRKFKLFQPNNFIVDFFSYLGKRTLIIYLLHVPILFLLLNTIFYFVNPEHYIDLFSYVKAFLEGLFKK